MRRTRSVPTFDADDEHGQPIPRLSTALATPADAVHGGRRDAVRIPAGLDLRRKFRGSRPSRATTTRPTGRISPVPRRPRPAVRRRAGNRSAPRSRCPAGPGPGSRRGRRRGPSSQWARGDRPGGGLGAQRALCDQGFGLCGGPVPHRRAVSGRKEHGGDGAAHAAEAGRTIRSAHAAVSRAVCCVPEVRLTSTRPRSASAGLLGRLSGVGPSAGHHRAEGAGGILSVRRRVAGRRRERGVLKRRTGLENLASNSVTSPMSWVYSPGGGVRADYEPRRGAWRRGGAARGRRPQPGPCSTNSATGGAGCRPRTRARRWRG